MAEFTTIVGLPKALNYEMDENTQWKSTYSQKVWNLYDSADKVYPFSQNPLYLGAQSAFVYYSTFRTSLETSAIDYLLRDKDSHTNAKDFFKGIIDTNTKAKWEQSYGRFFED